MVLHRSELGVVQAIEYAVILAINNATSVSSVKSLCWKNDLKIFHFIEAVIMVTMK